MRVNCDYPITVQGLNQLIRNRQRYSEEAEGGVCIKPRLQRRVAEGVGLDNNWGIMKFGGIVLLNG